MRRIAMLSILAGCGGHPSNQTPDGTPDGTTVIDAPKPDTYPRLVVAGDNGVQIWDHADAIGSDRAADATFGGMDGAALGLAVHDDQLYVTSSSTTAAVYRFAGVSTATDGAMPAASISPVGFGGALRLAHTPLQADHAGDLWISAGAIHLVAGAATATAPSAHFTHPWEQIAGMAYDDAGDRLYGGQISGAGLLAWNDAATRTGTVTASDWTLDATTAFQAEIAGGRLYTSHYSPPDLAIWDAIGSTSAARPPDVTLGGVCGTGTNYNELRYVTVTDTDVLVVIHNEVLGGTQVEKVCLFTGASAMTVTRAPDAIAADPSLHPTASNSDKAVLTADGHLFVMDRDGVAIFKDALVQPVFVTKLTTITSPRDLLVLE